MIPVMVVMIGMIVGIVTATIVAAMSHGIARNCARPSPHDRANGPSDGGARCAPDDSSAYSSSFRGACW
jgi:hypothetical protein